MAKLFLEASKMKKNVFILVAILLFPVFLSAQSAVYPYAGREGKMMALGEVLAQAFSREMAKQARAADTKNFAQKEGAKAHAAFKALLSAYPEYETLLSKVMQGHSSMERLVSQQQNETKLAEQLNIQLKYLYGDMLSLRKKNPEVAVQVRQILNHEYWIASRNEAMNFDKIKNFVEQELNLAGSWKEPVPSWTKEL